MSRWCGWVFAIVAACGGDHDKNGDNDVDARPDTPPDMPGQQGGVAGHALLLHGPRDQSMNALRLGPVPAPADGRWSITPDQAKIHLVSLDFVRTDGQPYSAMLTDCEPTYDRTAAPLMQMLDCPFEVPAGSYAQVGISTSTTYQMLLDDGVNGFFTNGTSVVTSDPGTPSFNTYTVPGPGGVGTVLGTTTYLTAALVVDESHPVQVDVLVDMIHTVGADVSGGAVTVDVSAPTLPATLVPSVLGAGKAEFYSAESDPGNMKIGPLGNTGTWGGVRVFYAEPSQPSYLFYPVVGPSQAYNVDPAKAPANGTSNKAGGYLGIDGSNTMCWAMPTDSTYTAYTRVCKMPIVSPGSTTTVSCQTGSTAPAPTSGDTYASGCPTITPNETLNVTLIAN